MTILKDFTMQVGSTGDWRKDLSGPKLGRYKKLLRQIVSSSFPLVIRDSWIQPSLRPGYSPADWKTKAGFLTNGEQAFVAAIESLECQDDISDEPLALVRAKLGDANAATGKIFGAATSTPGSFQFNGCYIIDNIWRHSFSFQLLLDGQPWVLTLKDQISGEQVDVPILVVATHDCSLDDCD